MFRFTRKPSSGGHSQYLSKITHLVQSGYVEAVQDVVSVMAAYCDLCVPCSLVHGTHACNVHSHLVAKMQVLFVSSRLFNAFHSVPQL